MDINNDYRELQIKKLLSTQAGEMAYEMDMKDGIFHGEIPACVWNEYAEGQEGRTNISEGGFINVFDAADSITTYMIREEARENWPNAEPAEKDDPTIDYD